MIGDPSGPSARPARRAERWLAPLAFFLAAWGAAVLFYSRHPLLYDTDAYYHLAVGRLFAAHGWVSELPWVRFSAFAHGFGDKELLFHTLLAPFAVLSPGADGLAGGRLALAFFDALVLTTVGVLARRAIGRWGWAMPLFLAVAVSEFSWRLVRLRPELLALVLLLLALAAAAAGRHRLLGLLALAFTLSYTAFQAFLGIFGVLFLFTGWARRRWLPGLVLYPVLGVGLGLVLHPHFPKNLEIWALQNVTFFAEKGALDVGSEIRPNSTDVLLLMPLGWTLALVALLRSAEPRGEGARREAARAAADAFGVAAVLFGGLYLLMSRFSIYFYPLATLAVLFSLEARGLAPGRRVRLPFRGRVPLAAALALALAVALPGAARELATFARRTSPGPDGIRLADRAAVARALPAGARVAAPWQSTHLYLFAAPWARYLNVLDPVFMAVPFPRAYAVERQLFDGDLPDVPLAAATKLSSDHLAFSTTGEGQKLLERLAGDPRVVPLHVGLNAVFRLVPDANRAFVLDWRRLPAGAALPPPAEAAVGPAYPRLPPALGGRFEGYVDARRGLPAGDACQGLAHDSADSIAPRELLLAADGPTTLWVDGRRQVSAGGSAGAVLGRGVAVPLPPGPHRLVVLTCPAGPGGRMGFYLEYLDPARR